MNNHKINHSNQINHTHQQVTCANCWGHQQWDGQTVDKKFHWAKHFKTAFILNFVKKYF